MLKSFWFKAGISGAAAALLVAGFVGVNAQGNNGVGSAGTSQTLSDSFNPITGKADSAAAVKSTVTTEAAKANADVASDIASVESTDSAQLAQQGATGQEQADKRLLGGATTAGGGGAGGGGTAGGVGGAAGGVGGSAGGAAGGTAGAIGGTAAAAAAGTASGNAKSNDKPISPSNP